MLPIGPAGEENSPYQSCSAFGGNPLLLSPDRLVEQGFLGRQDIELPLSGGGGNVDYSAAARLKLPWLRKAFEHFQKHPRDGTALAHTASLPRHPNQRDRPRLA